MGKRRVLVTGLGSLSPIGLDVPETARSLLAATPGISEWSDQLFPHTFPAGVIRADFSRSFRRMDLPFLDRCSQLAVLSAGQAVADAAVSDFAPFGHRAGVYVGSTRGGAKTEQDWYYKLFALGHREAGPFTVLAAMGSAPASQLSIRNKVLGPVITHACACASSGAAIGDAFRMIRDGYLDIALAGGAEAPLTYSMLTAWAGTRALAPISRDGVAASCRPFDDARSGLVLGEGAAFLVLESEESALLRNVRHVHGEVAGYGIASDGYHIASPAASGQVSAMRAALSDAGIDAESVGYVNAHATATRGGDVIEAEALRETFGDFARLVPVSATKSMHGHLLGAASALEFVITTLAVEGSFLPPTINLSSVDPACQDLLHVANDASTGVDIEYGMSNSSGFGGTNVSLVVRRWNM